jgi:hypothetical protein
MEQSDTTARSHQVDRDAIGDGDGEQDPRSRGDPAVDPIHVHPTPAGIQSHQFGAVNLVTQGDYFELVHGATKGQPAAHHLTDRFYAPQTQIVASP